MNMAGGAKKAACKGSLLAMDMRLQELVGACP